MARYCHDNFLYNSSLLKAIEKRVQLCARDTVLIFHATLVKAE